MKKVAVIGLMVIVACLLLVSQGSAFYQWEDENGVIHYGDAPPDDAAGVSEQGGTTETGTPESDAPPAGKKSPDTAVSKRDDTGDMPEEIKEVIDSFTLAPHTKKEISFVSFEPVVVGFKTDLTKETAAKCKNSGAGIKDKYSGKEVISPYGGKAEFKPENGYIKFYVGNLEDFPINILLFKY